MARWKANCIVTRNFAFGDKQYKKGKHVYLNGEVKEFAALNRCAVMIEEAKPKGSDTAP
jgi:hypothetical protein